MTPDLVVLGNLLVDDVVFADGATRMGQPGGAVLYAALGAHLSGLSVGVVSWHGDDYPQQMLHRLAARGIDLAGVHPLDRPGLRTWLLYEGRLRRVVHRLEGPSHAEVSPGADRIPPAWRTARAFHLAPMPLDLQRDLVEALARRPGALVSLDPYDLLRTEDLPAWRRLLERVDLLFLSEDEALFDRHPGDALARLLGGRLRQIAFKRGSRGGALYSVDTAGTTSALKWQPRDAGVVDPTGAGDAFAAGYLAGQLRGDPPERALERAVVAASFALQGHGPEGLLAATPETARERLREWFG